jgi:aminoglycoside phosphotransferase (APT) family kinase protein
LPAVSCLVSLNAKAIGLKLPDFPTIQRKTLDAIIKVHRLSAETIQQLPELGIFNSIYQLGEDLILRIPRNHPAFIAAAQKEALAVPIARRAGLRTPELLIFDESLELLPVPYSIYKRVHGQTLGLMGLEPDDTPQVWRELGHDLALLHSQVEEDEQSKRLGSPEDLPNAYACIEKLSTEGYIGETEAKWFQNWMKQLEPALQGEIPKRFLHGDIQSTNLMVNAEKNEYLALIDWGSAGWGDPACDFAGIPLRAVPFMLEGYRDGLSQTDESLEARILWRHLHLAFFLLNREAQPQRSWAERPQAMFIEIMRFFLEAKHATWKKFIP